MSVIGTKDIAKLVLDIVEEASSHVTSTNHLLRLSDEIVLTIFRHLPLKDLVTVSLVDKRFLRLSRDASLWTELTLDYKDFQCQRDSLLQLVERCNKLSNLKITNDSNIRSSLEMMSVVVKAKETLESLEIDSWIRNWTSGALKLLGDMRELKSLTLDVEIKWYSVFPYFRLEEIGKLSQLEELNINVEFGAEGVEEEIMKNIFLQLRKLKVVDISHANDAVVDAIASNNRDLKSLSITEYCNVSDEGISVLADSCANLEELWLEDFCSIGALNQLSSSCIKIKCLQFHKIVYEAHNDDINDETLIKVIGQFNGLESLRLRNCYEVTDHGVETVVKAARRLKSFHIGYAPQVTKALVKRLRTENPELDLWVGTWDDS